MASASDRTRTGTQVLRLVEIMDQLRSENGCPWDAQQTHETLSEYLLEETYETLAAIEQGETADLVEELGDLLLQVVFHARLGQEESPSWDIDDVASGISTKLIRRHPHVFARSLGEIPVDGAGPLDSEQLARSWTRAKAVEKGRDSALDGIPRALPALAQAQKTWRRAVESGLTPTAPSSSAQIDDQEQLGDHLMGIAVAAEDSGMDAEAALRTTIAKLRLEILELESQAEPGQVPPIKSG